MVVAKLNVKDPDHDEAWTYFRSVVNPRWVEDHTVEIDEETEKTCCPKRKKYRLATSDEEHATAIPIWSSTVDDLGMFGIGIGLYYKQIQAFAYLAIAYGLILIPSLLYYSTTTYNNVYNDVQNGTVTSIPFLLKGSAICSDYEIVKTTVDCDSSTQICRGYYADECLLVGKYGIYDFVAMAMLIIYVIYTGRLQAKQVEEIDLAEQTPQDYSVIVQDPDEDADDPDEWEQFFSQFGEVAYISIARKNRGFLKLLAQRRVIRHEMFLHGYSEEISVSERTGLITPEKPSIFAAKDEKYWHYKLWKVSREIDELKKQTFPVCKVYCIFSDENGQRECLNTLTTGKIPAMFEIGNLENKFRFRGTNVLEIEEPVEPSEVIWHNLELSGTYLFFQGVVSSILTLIIIICCYFIIVQLKEGAYAKSIGILVSLINVILPIILKLVVLVENHVDDGDRQDSLFFKLTCARFMNTAIINWVTTSFQSTLSLTSLKTIQSILISDAIITPTVSLMDLGGFFKRNVMSKFAKTHPKLMSHFTGTKWYLGERYTSYTKTFFVAVFYAALYPGGMFVAAICFTYGYWVDKYLLLRVWKKPPHYDAQLASQARGHIMFSVLVHLLVTANWYYGWPFDNVISTPDGLGHMNKASITPGDPSTWYKFFYMTPQTWQNESQQFLVLIYGHGSLILLILLTIFYFAEGVWDAFMSLWYGDYDEVGESMGIPYQDVDNIEVFMPMCYPPSNEMAGPLVAAHCINVSSRHYPDMQRKIFSDQNVAEEFDPDIAMKIFGVVKGFNITAKNIGGQNRDEEKGAMLLEKKARGGIEMSPLLKK